jgi:hypothetical protein
MEKSYNKEIGISRHAESRKDKFGKKVKKPIKKLIKDETNSIEMKTINSKLSDNDSISTLNESSNSSD